MSDAIKVAKKRGRPKKTVEPETIVIIDSSDVSGLQKEILPTKKSKSTKSSISSSEIDLGSRKRVTRKSVSKNDAEVETPKVVRTRRSAKSAETVTLTVEDTIDGLTGTAEASRSSILNQATAFQELKIENSVADTVGETPQQVVDDLEVAVSKEPISEDTVGTPSPSHQILYDIESRLSALRNNIRSSSIKRVEISLHRSANHPSQLANSIQELRSEIAQRKLSESRQNLDQRLADLAETISQSSSELQSLIQSRRSHRIQHIAGQIKDLTIGTLHTYKALREAEETALSTTAALLARKTQTYSQFIESQVKFLSNNIQESRQELAEFTSRQQSIAQIVSVAQLAVDNENRIKNIQSELESLGTSIEEFSTVIRNTITSRLAIQQPPSTIPSIIISENQIQNVQSQLDSQSNKIGQSKPAIQNLTHQTSKSELSPANPIQPTSQASQDQPSTQPTMSSLQRPRQTQQPNRSIPPSTPSASASPSRINPKSTNPQPQPLPPTQQPYDTLRKSPTFKRESRRWTALIVGIPVLFVTSWVLYKRYESTIQARISSVVTREEIEGRRRGQLPPPSSPSDGSGNGNGPGKGIGVDRSSDVGVNGGV